ncbi:diacylglycerol/lipid kinase family protein [Deferribacter abyssi]|uniref:diacylglycerol/lipid kinase family protein n=1 Tax=Deferribacter abyssi TaxID=213806 RepID=UPI003C143E7F
MKTIIVANPVSGSFNREIFDNCLKILYKKLTDIKVVFTEYVNHAEKISHNEEYDLIITAGGDGLINEVINGIESRRDKNKAILFYNLPFGTSNVFCREYNIPLKPELAAEKMSIVEFDSIPLGFIGGRYFTLMLGVGFDATAVKYVDLAFKKKYGKMAYIKSGINSLLFKKFYPFNVYINGRKINAYHMIVAVSNKYAGNFVLSRAFKKNLLNIFYLDNKSKLKLLKNIVSISFHKGFVGNKSTCNILKICGTDEFQLDGDFFKLNSKNNFVKLKKSSFFLIKSL